MSIVPYSANREVVLRHNDAVVVYDSQSRQLQIGDASSQDIVDLVDCPYCHQPLHRKSRARSTGHAGPTHGIPASFVNPEYFRMLDKSLGGSAESSAPLSPRRRLVEPVGVGHESSRSPGPSDYFSGNTPALPSPSGISANAFSQGYFERAFVEERVLGKGGKGVVLLVTHMLDKVDLGQFACKRVPVGDDHEWLKKVLIEVQLLQRLLHPHLVSYQHVWLENSKLSNFSPSVPCAFILQQYCNTGDLHQYVISPAQSPELIQQQLRERARRRSRNQLPTPRDLHNTRKLSLQEIRSFFKDITAGLNHLHINGYIHRDLKPSNCLLHDAGDGKGLRVLVSDFGEVQVENIVRKSTGSTGTISYCAPEVLHRQPSGALGDFTFKSDIFSLGMILYFLCFARLPYRNADVLNEESEDLDHLRAEITAWKGLHEERKLRPDLPEQLYIFLRRLLSLDPNERPSAEDILLGIKTGSGLDEISEGRPKSAGHMLDDLSSSSRISLVDSPRPSTPARKMSSGFAKPAKLHLDSCQKERRRSADVAENEGDAARAMSPSNSLVLRSQFSSPTRMLHKPMPPPPPALQPSVLLSRLSLRSAGTARPIRLVVLLLKVISLNTLCAPVAANPVVTYSLLGLASLDVLLNGTGVGISIALMVLHIAILLGAARAGVLCMQGMDYWKEIGL